MKKITSLASIKNKVTDQTNTLKDKATEASGRLGDIADVDIEKLKGAVDEVNTALPIVEKVGYRAKELEIELGITPGVIIHFEKFCDASAEEIETILKENEDKKVIATVIKALNKADELRAGMKLGKFIFSEVELELGISPKIKMKYLEGKENSDESGSGQTEDTAANEITAQAPEKIDVNCGSCQRLVGKVDSAKIPEQGLKVKCPKCQDPILVKP